MNNNVSFANHCVTQSGGWLPMMPLGQSLALGDFGQQQGLAFEVLGNIRDLSLVQPVNAVDPVSLGDQWCWSDGVAVNYRGLASEADNIDSQWQKQVLGFNGPGSFAFHGRQPQAQWLLNWAEFAPDITLKLTQSVFNFREVMVITAVATVEQWGLVVADSTEAELVVLNQDSSDWSGLSHHSAQLSQSRGLSESVLGCEQPAYFFKAKKLILSQTKQDQLLQQLLLQPNSPTGPQLSHWLSAGLMNRLQPHELNLNTCLETFDWADVTLADFN